MRLLRDIAAILILVTLCRDTGLRAESFRSDVVIYGATPSGIMAAVQAQRLGKSVQLVEASKWLGGMVAGGLSSTDIGFEKVISGLTAEYFKRTNAIEVAKGAQPLNEWMVEPHVAKEVFCEMLSKAGISPHLGDHLIEVQRAGAKIISFTTAGGNTFAGTIFIDASYEGELMTKAGVSYTWGRDAVSRFNEVDAGTQIPFPYQGGRIDAYNQIGDPQSGLIFSVQPYVPLPLGSADQNVMGYNFRHCTTDNLANAVPYSTLKPPGYDAAIYAGVKRTFDDAMTRAPSDAAKLAEHTENLARHYFGPARDPKSHELRPYANRKFDINGGTPFGSNVVHFNNAYVNGSPAVRAAMRTQIANYNMGLYYFMATDPGVPAGVRDFMARFGACADEFTDNNNFPTQLYVREARRMQGDYIMNAHNVTLKRLIEDPIALAGYDMDTHLHQLVAINGKVFVEGKQFSDGTTIPTAYTSSMIEKCTPYGISYRAITPKTSEAENLLVTVTVSASALANYSLRLEPQYMMMGQAAAFAAALAIDKQQSVQEISYPELREKLLEAKLLLDVAPDFMIMHVCVDASDNVIYGLSPLDAACVKTRKIRVGERVPYHLSSVLGPKQKQVGPTVGAAPLFTDVYDNLPLVHDDVTRIVSTQARAYDLNSFQPTSGAFRPERVEVFGFDKEFAFQMAEWQAGSTKSDAGALSGGLNTCLMNTNDGPRVQNNSRRYYRHQVVGPFVVDPMGSAGFRRFESTFAKDLPALDAPCPTPEQLRGSPTLTLWAHENFAYGGRDTAPVLRESIINDLFVGHSSPDLSDVLKRNYFAKGFGLLRTETWIRANDGNRDRIMREALEIHVSGACRKPYERKNIGDYIYGEMDDNDGHAYSQIIRDPKVRSDDHQWYMVDCTDLSNIVVSPNPVGDAPVTSTPHPRFWDLWAK